MYISNIVYICKYVPLIKIFFKKNSDSKRIISYFHRLELKLCGNLTLKSDLIIKQFNPYNFRM